MKLLMHACCAPCSVYCIDELKKENIEPTIYWYNPTYNLETSFIEQNVNKKALSIICLIDLKYWCNEEEKRSITQKIKKNQLIINQKNQELYNNIFKKNNINEDKSVKSKEIMLITKENFFIRIIHKIKKFFLRKLKNK